MYLKSLVLKGFKSFADRTVLSLEPGMTVVVGPNGSGKSNISDAVLWVLGEQSAKQLRGQAMEDVIFAGSSARQAVGLAEVDLVLDNSDGTLPLEFSEVVITRRMYRSGESEYLINGSPSRLMDVLDILNDSGLGRDTHSIISQGSLQNVLHARPEDRRVLIEEAAGILKHKKRKERSERKLKNMDAALQRVHDIQNEVERQLKPLERQASRARQHEQISSELHEVELTLAVDDLRQLQDQWNETLRQEKEADAAVELARFRTEEKSAELEKYQRLLEEKGLFVGDLAEQRRRCQTVLERLDASMLLLEEKGRNMVTRLSELRQTIHHCESRINEVRDSLQSYEAESQNSDAKRSELEVQLEKFNQEAQAARKNRRDCDSRISQLNAKLRACEKSLDENMLSQVKANEALSTADVEEGLLVNRASQIEESLQATQTTLGQRRTRLEDLDAQLKRLQRDSELAKQDIDTRTRLVDDAQKELHDAREALNILQAQAQGLREIDRALDSSRPLLAWSLEHEESISGTLTPLREVFSSSPAYEKLVEQVLGADLFGLLVQDADSAGELAEQLLSHKVSGGELSLIMCKGKKVARKKAATGTRLLDFLTYDAEYEHVAELLLGDVYVVDSVQDALAALANDTTASRFVTRDGVMVWPDGKMTLGMQDDADKEGVLSRKRRLEELVAVVPDAQAAIDAAQAKLDEAQERLQVAQADDFELSQTIARLTGETGSLRQESGRLEQSITGLMQEQGQIESRRAKIVEETAQAREKLLTLADEKTQLEAQKDEFAEQVAAANDERKALFGHEDLATRNVSTAQVDLATVRERCVHLKRQVEALSRESEELTRSLAVSRETEKSLEILRLRVEPLYQTFTSLREGITEKAQILRDRAQMEQAGQGDLRDTIEGARKLVSEEQAKLDEAQEGLTQIRIEKSKLEVRVEGAVKAITQDNGVLLDIALEIPAPQDRAQEEERAAKLRKRLSHLGAVNPVAIEEYRKLKERRDFIALQLEDLEAAAKSLQRIVAAIDRKMRNRFLETFEQVNANFVSIFAQLFPGGNGHLELTDPSSPETTGIEVHAQPRGKTVRKQTLLSGGEQSLVALALLFSVYRVRSTPFYILDEVEAALDDTNLRRMLSYLDSIRDETQLIIISHQRRTMEMADLLYGVSMRGDGVSKLVSQRLDQAIRQAQGQEDAPRDIEEFSGAS